MSGKSVTLNRNLRAAWLVEALKLRASGVDTSSAIQRLDEKIAQDISGAESRRKSLRYLRQVWIEPHAALGSLQDEASEIYRCHPSDKTAKALSFFMLLANYPFAREVAEACGQLFRLQGSVKTEQIKRKIVAQHGDREPILRSTRYAISIFSDLQILISGETRGTYVAGTYHDLVSALSPFALEALFKSCGKGQLARSDLDSHAALFAFDAFELVASAIADQRYGLSRESMSRELVYLVDYQC